MKISWTFDIGTTHKLSTKTVTLNTVDYEAKILPESFGGIPMRWSMRNNSLISPSDLDFEIDNTDAIYTRADFTDEYCLVKLWIDETLSRQWKFKIERVVPAYGVLKIYCVDILQEKLVGEYPNTQHPREKWPLATPDEDKEEEYDSYRIPIIFGTAYIPTMFVSIDETNYYYVLGPGAATDYTVSEVRAPSEREGLVWTNDYTFNEYTVDDNTLAQFMIAPFNENIGESGEVDISLEDPPGTYVADLDRDWSYVGGVWDSGAKPFVKYTYSPNSSTNPADIIEYVLEDFGVDSGNIDKAGTWATAKISYTPDDTVGSENKGIVWNLGLYEAQDREGLINNFLTQCHSFFYISDQIELHPFSKTSVETFDKTKIKKLSFRPSKSTKRYNDSGHVHWAVEGKPQHKLDGKALLPIAADGDPETTDNPDSEVLQLNFIQDSDTAQRIGKLYFEQKLTGIENISFETSGAKLDTIDTIKPGQVITMDDAIFGGEKLVIINNIHIRPDLTVSISGETYDYLHEYHELYYDYLTIPIYTGIPTFNKDGSLSSSINSAMVELFKRSDPIPTEILTAASPSLSVSANEVKRVYGTAVDNTINMDSGANVECTNFPGENTVTIASSFSLFSFSRSGTIVTFKGYDGTILKIPATGSNQTINFTDLTTNNTLRISGGQVLFGSTEVTVAKKYYPGLLAGTSYILSAGSPDCEVLTNRYAHIYGTSGVNTITLNTGSKAELVNSPGANHFVFPANITDITKIRSGTIATIWDSNGTVLIVPVTATAQTIQFLDGSVSLQITSGIIVLDGNPVPMLVTGGRPDLPTTVSTYNFETGELYGHDQEWYQTAPDGEGTLWKTTAMANAITRISTDNIDPDEWADPVILAGEGSPLYNSIVLNLYQRSVTLPVTTDIADPLVYTRANSELTGDTGSWSENVPAGNTPCYVTSATITSNFSSDEIKQSEWSTPVVMAQNGNTTVTLYNRTPLATSEILTAALPDTTVGSDETKILYGTSTGNNITIESGAKVEMINFPGENTITIQSYFSLFSFVRSGTTVTFSGFDGTVLKIPATTSNQTIIFNDFTTNNVLTISGDQVLFGTEEVILNKKYYPGFLVGTVEVLTSSFPNHTVLVNKYTAIYCTSAPNTITLNTGSKAKLINNPGENIINFPVAYSEVVFVRSGTIVTIRHNNGTVLEIPATSVEQTISFTDISTTIQIIDNEVILNGTVVDTGIPHNVPDLPTTTATYDIETHTVGNLNNGWVQEPEESDDVLWMTTALASDAIDPSTWSSPVRITHVTTSTSTTEVGSAESYSQLAKNHMLSGDDFGEAIALPTDATQALKMTQSEYNALATKGAATLYLIVAS